MRGPRVPAERRDSPVDAVRRSLYAVGEHMFVNVSESGGGAMLTQRQQEIWDFLVEYVDAHGYPPTVREIGERVGLASPSTVHAHLANLERAGLLRRDPTKPRALELIGRERRAPEPQPVERDDTLRLPLLGAIAAGGPLLADQYVEEYLPMPKSTKGDFMLRVKGESMIEAGILDGDLVIVQRAQDARDGEDVLPRERPRAPAARERVTRPDLRRPRPDPRPRRGSLPRALMSSVAPFARTLDQELVALLRGASLECLACGEFVMHARGGAVFCPECSSQLATEAVLAEEAVLESGLHCDSQAG